MALKLRFDLQVWQNCTVIAGVLCYFGLQISVSVFCLRTWLFVLGVTPIPMYGGLIMATSSLIPILKFV